MSSASSHKSVNTQPSIYTASVGVHTNRTGVNSPVDTGVGSPSSCLRPLSKEKVAPDSNHTGVNSTVDSGVDSPSSHLRPPSKEKVAPGKDHGTLPIPKFYFQELVEILKSITLHLKLWLPVWPLWIPIMMIIRRLHTKINQTLMWV